MFDLYWNGIYAILSEGKHNNIISLIIFMHSSTAEERERGTDDR